MRSRVAPRLRWVLALVFVCSAAAACSRAPDDAPPVATPSVTMNRSDAAIGSPIDMTYTFAVAAGAPAFHEDYWVFVHFLDADGELMWTDDHAPDTPTTQWKPGATVTYPRTMFVPKFPYVGEGRVEIGLFSRKTGERLPLGGQNMGMRSYRVATFSIRPQTDNLFVVFGDGWHETEVGDEGSGLEWQWSKKEGTLSFRNPKRDVVVFLQVDQPVALPSGPQHVDVQVGSATVDSFSPTQKQRDLRRVNLTAAQLGEGNTVVLRISVDKTFVPASISSLRSADPRELGIRVFRAYVQPK